MHKKVAMFLKSTPYLYYFAAAMQMRYEKLHDICNRYSDVMRPESLMQTIMPQKEAFQWQPSKDIALCTPTGLGQKGMTALFERLRNPDVAENAAMQALKENYVGAMKSYKKAIMVRHPMERLLSVYR